MGNVQGADPAGRPPLEGVGEDRRPVDGVGSARAEVVGRPPDRGTEPARSVGGQQQLGHLSANPALGVGRSVGQVLGHRLLDRPVHVQVVGQHQLGLGGGRPLQDGPGHGQELLRPAMVGGLGAVVDDRSPGAGFLGPGCGGQVAPADLDARGDVQVAAAVDGPHPVATAGELADDGTADPAAGAEHDLQVNCRGQRPSLLVGAITTKSLRLRVLDAGHRDQGRPPTSSLPARSDPAPNGRSGRRQAHRLKVEPRRNPPLLFHLRALCRPGPAP
jgi:hypothetical protein